ncbi:MAG TPA: DUF6062 family protein [bacterium]|nr:DUF6062 family protein [bacterium]
MPISLDVDKFLDILKPDRCPLCFLLQDYVHEHIKSLLEESVTDPVSRKALFQSRGFCRRHAWMGVQQGKHLGMSVIYASLLEKGLKELADGPKFWKKTSPKPCPICESEKKRDLSQIQQFAAAWEQSEKLRESFKTHGILCLNHLEKILQEKINATHRKSLYETGKKALEALLKELNEFLEKQDYHRSHESFGKERDAWIRVVRVISGERE